MSRKRGRPKGASNRRYHIADERLCVKMAELRLLNPGMSIWGAARKLAPEAVGFDGDCSHQGKCVRRLHDHYIRDQARVERLAYLRINPPKPMTPLEGMIASQRAIRPLIRAAEQSAALQNSILRWLKTR